MAHKNLITVRTETAALMQLAIRLEAADQKGFVKCVTCPGSFRYNEVDASHFIDGRTGAILFDERGIHPQCRICHSTKRKEYEAFMFLKFGQDIIDELRAKRHQIRSYTRQELADMAKGYRARIKSEKQRLGI